MIREASVCADFEAKLVELNGEDDHVHLLVEYPTSVALSRLVNSLKGVSSRMLRAREFPEVQRRLWGGHLWIPSYFRSAVEVRRLRSCASTLKTSEPNSAAIPALKRQGLRGREMDQEP